VAQWLRHTATNRKVAGSIPDSVIGVFHWHNPSGCTMAVEWTYTWSPHPRRCHTATIHSPSTVLSATYQPSWYFAEDCCHIIYHAISYHTISSHRIVPNICLYHTISYHAIYHTISYHRIVSYHLISSQIISYHSISYISYILSYIILYHINVRCGTYAPHATAGTSESLVSQTSDFPATWFLSFAAITIYRSECPN
jgi:hypothetical protein